MYKLIYDDSGKAIQASHKGNNFSVTEGPVQHLLCSECEVYFGRLETNGKDIIDQIRNSDIKPGNHKIFYDINYSRFKLFQISLLWRSSITTHPMFYAISLGKHQEILKTILNDKNPGNYFDYGCALFILTKNSHLKRIVWSPQRLKHEGRTCYKFHVSGIQWFYFVSSHPKKNNWNKYFLKENGELIVFSAKEDYEKHELSIMANEIRNSPENN